MMAKKLHFIVKSKKYFIYLPDKFLFCGRYILQEIL